jgi:hypothetical protein
MGAVEMGAGGSYRFEGSTITQIAYCLYCDKCGSFKIGKRVTLRILAWVSIAAIISTLFWYSARDGALPGAWFACFATSLVFISFTGVFQLGHKCKKCGNRKISMDNVLGYPANDRSILDVPYETTVKYYLDDY